MMPGIPLMMPCPTVKFNVVCFGFFFLVIAETYFELWPQIVTLTFSLETLILCVTYFLIMVYLFAKFDKIRFSKF